MGIRSEWDWTDEDEERLNDTAVRELVRRHRDEYETIVQGTLEARIAEQEQRLSDADSEIRRLRERLEQRTRERDRWRGRIEAGEVELAVPDALD